MYKEYLIRTSQIRLEMGNNGALLAIVVDIGRKSSVLRFSFLGFRLGASVIVLKDWQAGYLRAGKQLEKMLSTKET